MTNLDPGDGRYRPARPRARATASVGRSCRPRAEPQPPSDEQTCRGDLLTGEGLEEAVDGVGMIVHCATGNGRADIDGTRNLIRAALRAGRPHLIYVSIVGVDRVDMPYYRAKLACEQLVEHSGLPWTIQRTTQFHELIVWMCTSQRWLPVIVMPSGVSFQPDRRRRGGRPPGRAGRRAAGRPGAGHGRARGASRRRSGPRLRPLAFQPPAGGVGADAGAGIRGYREGGHLTPGTPTGGSPSTSSSPHERPHLASRGPGLPRRGTVRRGVLGAVHSRARSSTSPGWGCTCRTTRI